MSIAAPTIQGALPFHPPLNYLKELFRVLTLKTTKATFAGGGELAVEFQPDRDEAGDLSPRMKANVDEQLAIGQASEGWWVGRGGDAMHACDRISECARRELEGATAIASTRSLPLALVKTVEAPSAAHTTSLVNLYPSHIQACTQHITSFTSPVRRRARLEA